MQALDQLGLNLGVECSQSMPKQSQLGQSNHAQLQEFQLVPQYVQLANDVHLQ